MSDDFHSILGLHFSLTTFPSGPHYQVYSSIPLTFFPLPAPLPPPKEVINGNIKTVTEYKMDEDGKKFKVRLGEEVGVLVLGGGWCVLCMLVRKIPWAQEP